jgi:nitrate/TMAO reductase-like tetraheme cytochrome c subunit
MGWFDELAKVATKAKAKKALYDQIVAVEKEIDAYIAKFAAARKLGAEDMKKTFKTLGF